jgi:elongation factor P--beta-lysine ligase
LERMPPSGGVALGVDRLLMLISEQSSLDPLLPFC